MKFVLAAATVALVATSIQGGILLSAPGVILPSAHFAATPGIVSAPQQDTSLAHPAVVENAIAESQLPSELLNPFYKNPVIAAGLAKESWFTNKEFPVHNREAEKIPRSEIFKRIRELSRRR